MSKINEALKVIWKNKKKRKPKKILIKSRGYCSVNEKAIIQSRAVLLNRLITGNYNRVTKLQLKVPDKSRHQAVKLPLSANVISIFLRRWIKRHELYQLLPSFKKLRFCNHLFVVWKLERYMEFKALAVRLIPEKPNAYILIIYNPNPTILPIRIFHKDHGCFDHIDLAPGEMLVFVHFFEKKDPIVQWLFINYMARKYRRKLVRKLKMQIKDKLKSCDDWGWRG